MKIIGTIDAGNEYIVTATRYELTNVAGFNWYDDEGMPKLTIGADIQVGAMYDLIKGFIAAEEELLKAQKMLRAVADLLGPIGAAISNAAQEPTP